MRGNGEIPLVSVVITTYRRAALVQRAIRDVLNQTVQDVEVIVVDDASPDETERAVKGVRDPRVRYVRHEQNKGPSASRNTGIGVAQGEYIAFLDDDDGWREDKLERQLMTIKDKDAMLCDALWNGCSRRAHRSTTVSLNDLRKGSFASPGLLVKANIMKKVLFDESLWQGEDWDVYIRIAQQYSIGYVPEPLVFCSAGAHQRLTNKAKDLASPDLEKRAVVLRKHREFLGEKWFNYHLADTFLSYIGSRQSKLHCIGYAVKRCGLRAVAASITHKVHVRIRRLMWGCA